MNDAVRKVIELAAAEAEDEVRRLQDFADAQRECLENAEADLKAAQATLNALNEALADAGKQAAASASLAA